MKLWRASSYAPTLEISTSSRWPLASENSMDISCGRFSGLLSFCFRISTARCPRSSCALVAASRSAVPNCAKAASSLYCARSSRRLPATDFIALVWAVPPTRDTDSPAFTAGRTPELNSSGSRYICPSVIEMTLVGM